MTKNGFPRPVAAALGTTIVAGALFTGIPAVMAAHSDVPDVKSDHPGTTALAPSRPGVPASVTGEAGAAEVVAGRPMAAKAGKPMAAKAEAKARKSVAAKAGESRTTSGQFRQGSVAALLQVAEQQIGVRENASGGGTPFHRWYVDSPRAKETAARDGGTPQSYANAPWCAMFVSWVGDKAGLQSSVGSDAYTVTYAEWFKDNHHWGTKATPGAVVFYAWDGSKSISAIDHVGLVKKDNGDGTITTIEGNTGNGDVEQRVRPKSDVVGYGYPQYRS
jgi:hypothetical protein